MLDTIEKDFIRLVPIDLKVPGGRDSEQALKISQEIRNFYLGTRPVSEETLEEMIYVNIMSTQATCELI